MERQKNWTPGPWETFRPLNGTLSIGAAKEGACAIATIKEYFGPENKGSSANANLIAAAPDMYEALECEEDFSLYLSSEGEEKLALRRKWIPRIEEFGVTNFFDLPVAMRRAALAKAHGEGQA